MDVVEKLSNVQIEILKLFRYDLPEKQLNEIKSMLTKYFASSATSEMDKLWEEKEWNTETMQEWVNEHLRK
jgi:hypothetical protein